MDLLSPHRIAEIHICNRRDDPAVAARANELDVLVSDDGANWITLLSHTGPAPFGFDGTPLVVFANSASLVRFLLLRSRSAGCLHMDEVEVYGYPASASLSIAASGPVIPDDWVVPGGGRSTGISRERACSAGGQGNRDRQFCAANAGRPEALSRGS